MSASERFPPGPHTRVAIAISTTVVLAVVTGAFGFAVNAYEVWYGSDTGKWDAVVALSNSHSRLACFVLERQAREDDVTAIGHLGDCPSAKPLLVSLTGQGHSPDVRAYAAGALAALSGEDAIWAMVRQLWLHDPDRNVRSFAAGGVIGRLDTLPADRAADAIKLFSRRANPICRCASQHDRSCLQEGQEPRAQRRHVDRGRRSAAGGPDARRRD
jgi:hypothetical protein